MTKKRIYNQVVRLTSELASTKVAEKIFDAAKRGDSKEVENVFETFRKENPKLNRRIVSFGKRYNKFVEVSGLEREGVIFAIKECAKRGLFVFDTNKIDAPSFYVLALLGEIDESSFFIGWLDVSNRFVDALAKSSSAELAQFVSDESWQQWICDDVGGYSTLYDLLVGIFAGELKKRFE